MASGSAGSKAAAREDSASASHDLAQIYRDQLGFVWRVVRRLGVPFEALEDIVHDVFLVARRRLPELTSDADVRAWLFVLARGVVANDRRARERRSRRDEQASPPGAPADPEQLAAHAETVRSVEQFLRTIPEEQRIVFELIDIEGFSGPETAELVGARLDTVYSRCRLARAAFARHFEAASSRRSR
ncbi:MAG: sigma-70 family RNA polymerase sigma factor [Deltaproteobacteria bacterium]|nr:sigma-70 family RNA polymerase sigma factor [Nannocystaceae bacterium]